MSRSADIVVVGAGPAGAMAAFEAARRGFSVIVLEKSVWPRHKTCGAGISPTSRRILREAGLWEKVRAEAYPVYGLRLVAPSGREALLAGAESAHVLERSRLDALLVESVVALGAQFFPQTPVTAIEMAGDVVTGVVTPSGVFSARAVVVAGGANCKLVRNKGARTLQAAMAWYEDMPFTAGIMEMIYDPAILPHYLWLFPESERRVNIGLCLPAERRDRPISMLFEEMLSRHFGDRVKSGRRVKGILGHPIVVSEQVSVPARPGLLPAGEAAALVNPATGEGISFAMESGRTAVTVLAEAWKKGKDHHWIAATYQKRLARLFDRRFGAAAFFCRHVCGFVETAAWIGSSRLMRALTARAMAKL